MTDFSPERIDLIASDLYIMADGNKSEMFADWRDLCRRAADGLDWQSRRIETLEKALTEASYR